MSNTRGRASLAALSVLANFFTLLTTDRFHRGSPELHPPPLTLKDHAFLKVVGREWHKAAVREEGLAQTLRQLYTLLTLINGPLESLLLQVWTSLPLELASWWSSCKIPCFPDPQTSITLLSHLSSMYCIPPGLTSWN